MLVDIKKIQVRLPLLLLTLHLLTLHCLPFSSFTSQKKSSESYRPRTHKFLHPFWHHLTPRYGWHFVALSLLSIRMVYQQQILKFTLKLVLLQAVILKYTMWSWVPSLWSIMRIVLLPSLLLLCLAVDMFCVQVFHHHCLVLLHLKVKAWENGNHCFTDLTT